MKRITDAYKIVLKRARRGTFKDHIPLEDPNQTNNERVRMQRMRSGRFNQAKDTRNK